MRTQTLCGVWQVSFRHPKTGKQHTIPAAVPGNVGADLMRAKVVPDLYRKRNVLQAQEWERTDFIYATSFVAPALKQGERLELHFEGVDTAATVALNGRPVASLDNMFVPHTVDITGACRTRGPNTLTVTIHNVIDYAADRARRWGIDGFEFCHLPFYEAIFARKAQHMFGWDIAPRMLFGGLWRSVTLRVRSPSEILADDFYFAVRSVDARRSQASVEIAYGLALDPQTDWQAYELHIHGRSGDSAFSRVIPLRFTHGKERFMIEDAKLWWPAGYGDQNLYDLSVSLAYKGAPVDTYTTRVGVRTTALDFHASLADPDGNRFQIVVNGVNIFARGSNWVAADALHACDAERIPRMLALFRDTHCNIVRCWGGNVYEDHPFFDFCDEHGIMVWQDFMFGCARYPHEDAFLAGVRDEARRIIRRLRNHPALVLWAGDNEVDSSYTWANPGHTPPSFNRISRVVLKEAVACHDPFRPYLPSSPYVSDDMHVSHRHQATPEQHLWGPRGYFKDDFYRKNTARFASEIGYHGMPARKSLERFLSKDKVWGAYNNDEWILHAANYTDRVDSPMGQRNRLMLNQVRQLFGDSVDVDNIDDFILASQITQAEADKYFIELFRAGKPRRTGIIWWNMIDCWPQFSDAVVDYYFEKKLAYRYIRRAQEPVALMVAENDRDELAIVAVNDTMNEKRGAWRLTDAVHGRAVLSGVYRIEPNGSVALGVVEKSDAMRVQLLEWSENGETRCNHFVNGKAPWDFKAYRAIMETFADR